MGGAAERTVEGRANTWAGRAADFHTLAVECVAGAGAVVRPRVPGLPDEAFANDGQLTKREVRAVTLAALAPLPRALLWDVGAGSGSVAIEWMRAGGDAIAIEGDALRVRTIADNAAALGVPNLRIVTGAAPAALEGLDPPDAVFVGGGLTSEGLLEACWRALKPAGRLVANAVTLEGEQVLAEWRARVGGELTRNRPIPRRPDRRPHRVAADAADHAVDGAQTMTGRLYGLGIGPGDPELITLKALKRLRAAPVIAYPAPLAGDSLARAIAAPHLPGGQTEIAIRMPMVAARFPAREVYDDAARRIGEHLAAGRDVARAVRR